jgi:hypothetical protein
MMANNTLLNHHRQCPEHLSEELPLDITPHCTKAKHTLDLDLLLHLSTQETESPLSQSLWLAALPEEGGGEPAGVSKCIEERENEGAGK